MAAKTSGVRSTIGMEPPVSAAAPRCGADKVSDAPTLSTRKKIVYTFPDMDAKKGIPPKLRARRVRDHVTRVLIELRRERVQRDAVRCVVITEISWDTLDLYTIALDAAEDDELRFLVQQARGTIITALVRSCRDE
jgi:hypothetical protein